MISDMLFQRRRNPQLNRLTSNVYQAGIRTPLRFKRHSRIRKIEMPIMLSLKA
jgi:hypothetical protein